MKQEDIIYEIKDNGYFRIDRDNQFFAEIESLTKETIFLGNKSYIKNIEMSNILKGSIHFLNKSILIIDKKNNHVGDIIYDEISDIVLDDYLLAIYNKGEGQPIIITLR